MTSTPASIYHDPETDEYTVSSPDFDDFCTFDEQEAKDEFDAMNEHHENRACTTGPDALYITHRQ